MTVSLHHGICIGLTRTMGRRYDNGAEGSQPHARSSDGYRTRTWVQLGLCRLLYKAVALRFNLEERTIIKTAQLDERRAFSLLDGGRWISVYLCQGVGHVCGVFCRIWTALVLVYSPSRRVIGLDGWRLTITPALLSRRLGAKGWVPRYLQGTRWFSGRWCWCCCCLFWCWSMAEIVERCVNWDWVYQVVLAPRKVPVAVEDSIVAEHLSSESTMDLLKCGNNVQAGNGIGPGRC